MLLKLNGINKNNMNRLCIIVRTKPVVLQCFVVDFFFMLLKCITLCLLNVRCVGYIGIYWEKLNLIFLTESGSSSQSLLCCITLRIQ